MKNRENWKEVRACKEADPTGNFFGEKKVGFTLVLAPLYSFPQAGVPCLLVGGGREKERDGTGLAPGSCAPSSARDLEKVVEAEPHGVILGPLRGRCWQVGLQRTTCYGLVGGDDITRPQNVPGACEASGQAPCRAPARWSSQGKEGEGNPCCLAQTPPPDAEDFLPDLFCMAKDLLPTFANQSL